MKNKFLKINRKFWLLKTRIFLGKMLEEISDTFFGK